MQLTLTAARGPLITAAILFAGFVAAAMVTAPTPADAKNRTCVTRNDDCIQRCMKSNKETAAGEGCIQRTCNHQFNQCIETGQLPSGVGKNDRDPRPSRPPAGGERPPKRGPKGGVVVR